MHQDPTTRPLTEKEKDFYSTMAEHYADRAAANPDNFFLKNEARTMKKINQAGELPTFTAIPGEGYSLTD